MKKTDSQSIQGIGMTSERTRRRLLEQLEQAGISNKLVLSAMQNIPRHLFIDEALESRAYENIALPIGYNQTISQPYIVARMTEALLGDKTNLEKVLEIGTGSGYQAAVLSTVATKVYTIERIKNLLDVAKKRFSKLRIFNIITRYDDGSNGWLDNAPFDGIIVTCAMQKFPKELLMQLKEGGRMVLPLDLSEEHSETQHLQIITKTAEGHTTTNLELVRFVPLLAGRE